MLSVKSVAKQLWGVNMDREAFLNTFQVPPAEYLPRARWWVPGSKLDSREIDYEIRDCAKMGLGGVEVINMNTQHPDWGTERWLVAKADMLGSAGIHGITIDSMFSGPFWFIGAQGLTEADECVQQEAKLTHSRIIIDRPGLVEITVPMLKAKPARHRPFDFPAVNHAFLVAVSAAKELDQEDGTSYLDISSAVNLGRRGDGIIPQERVDLNGERLTVYFRAPSAGTWVIFGLWQWITGDRQGNAYVIDHFSADGAKQVTNNWNRVFTEHPELQQMYRAHGGSMFGDSIELTASHQWTSTLLKEFQARRGYDLAPYVGALFFPVPDEPGRHYDPYLQKPMFDFHDMGEKIRNDYHQVLTELLIENHILPLKAWSNQNGMTLRYQSSYGTPTDMAQVSDHIDIPETESLFFQHRIDGYRAQAGSVHVGGKKRYSTELIGGFAPFDKTWEHMLWAVNRSFAGGVNMMVYHAYTYRTDRRNPQETWPGYVLMGEMWGDRQPSWNKMDDVSRFIGRTQYLLQQGQPMIDLAVYRLCYWENNETGYISSAGLDRNGYSYDFIGPAHLNTADFASGRLFPHGPAYRALILNHETALPLETARQILNLAKQGLPILLVGSIPQDVTYFAGSMSRTRNRQVELQSVMAELLALPVVRVLDEELQLPQVLGQMGILAGCSYAEQPFMTIARRGETGRLYYILAQDKLTHQKRIITRGSGEATEVELSLEGSGVPYEINPWTGTVRQIGAFRRENGRILLHTQLHQNEVKLFAVSNSADNALFVLSPDADYCTRAGDQLRWRMFQNGKNDLLCSDGTTRTVEATGIPSTMDVNRWHLTLDSWLPGKTSLETDHTYLEYALDELAPWDKLPEAENVSGVGTYTASFFWPGDPYGAILDLGQISDTYHLFVNGRRVHGCNILNTQIDISKFLKSGENKLRVEVASNLQRVMSASTVHPRPPMPMGADAQEPEAFGLMGPVRLHPFRDVTVIK